MIAKLTPSTGFLAVLLQALGMVAVAIGAGIVAGLGVGLVVGGALALIAGVALEREAADARKPPA